MVKMPCFNRDEKLTRPGIAIGLAYTEMGGRCLLIETAKYPGNGNLQLTGQLGNVMKESIGTSLSCFEILRRLILVSRSHGYRGNIWVEAFIFPGLRVTLFLLGF